MRKTLHCRRCNLHQFERSDGKCGKCGAPYGPPEEPESALAGIFKLGTALMEADLELTGAGRMTNIRVPGKPMFSKAEALALAMFICRANPEMRENLEAVRMSQRDLAVVMGVARTYVSNVERCCLTPGVEQLFRMAAAMNTTPWHILRVAEFLMYGE